MQMEYIRVPEARARQIPAAVPLPARDSRRWISSDEFEQLLSLNLPEQATAVIERGTSFNSIPYTDALRPADVLRSADAA